MKTIDVLFPAYINATIGPCGTLRRLNKNKEYIKSRGYYINIFTLDNAIKKQVGEGTVVDFSKGLGFRSKVKGWLSKSTIGLFLMHKHDSKLSKKLVDFYLQQNRKADIVVFHETRTCGIYVPHKYNAQKIVCFFHSDGTRWGMVLNAHPFLKGSWWLKIQDKKMDRVLKLIDHYVFIAKMGQENFLAENFFVKRESTSFFHNGIENIPIIGQSNNKKQFKYNLCTVGSLSHRKGQYLIVEAMHRLPDNKLKDFYLTIYGNGPDYVFIKKQINDYNLSAHVELYGNLPNGEVHEKMCQNNIFLLMSNNEGLPISIIEAMRAGLPVISTKVSGIPEEVDEQNGILINPNVEELADVLLNMNSYDWAEMGLKSRERFEKEFSFNAMLNSYCDMLDKVSNQ